MATNSGDNIPTSAAWMPSLLDASPLSLWHVSRFHRVLFADLPSPDQHSCFSFSVLLLNLQTLLLNAQDSTCLSWLSPPVCSSLPLLSLTGQAPAYCARWPS